MINMKEWRIYLLLALLIVLLIGFIAAGKSSPAYTVSAAKTINCNSINLNFNATVNGSVTAPEGTNTFFNIPVKNNGNVTENISLDVSPNGSVPFTIESAKTFELNVSSSGFTSFGVYSPTKNGTYSVTANVSAAYLNCVDYKPFPINVTVVNSTK